MLAATKSTGRGPAKRSRGPGGGFTGDVGRRIRAFALARPGSVALALLFGGLGIAVSANALWMQSAHHPAPLFRQAALQPPRPAAAPVSAPSAASDEDAPAAPVLPPARPAGLGRAAEAPVAPAPKPAGKRPTKDPIADLLGGAPPVPPAPVKAPAKGQPVEKAARPAPRGNDAIAGLIEQTARNH